MGAVGTVDHGDVDAEYDAFDPEPPDGSPVTRLPLDRMWDDAKHWLPRILAGERVRASFTYAQDCETVVHADLSPLPAGR